MRRDMLNDDDDAMDKEISDFLSSYVVSKPEEEKIEETINVLKDYMPAEKEKYPLLKIIRNQLTFISIPYIFASVMLVIFGVYIALSGDALPCEVMMIVSPLPVVIGIYEIAKNRNGNVWELERSFKYSYSIISLARLVIITIISSLINTILTIFLCSSQYEILLKCMTSWIVPMAIVFTGGLIIFHKISSTYAAIGVSSIWFIFLAVYHEEMMKFIDKSSVLILISMITASIALFAAAIIRFYKNEKRYEGEVIWN